MKLQATIDKMFKRSQKKFIFPVMYYGLLDAYIQTGKTDFTTQEVRDWYEKAVCNLVRNYLKHNLHVGGLFWDAYPSRNLPKYGVLKVIDPGKFKLIRTENANELRDYILTKLIEHIQKRIGNLHELSSRSERIELSADVKQFLNFIEKAMEISGTCFELISFAIVKTHMERFGCKVYRETRAEASDRGTDLSTDFGVVYQVKKLRLKGEKEAENLYNTLRNNFGQERVNDGKVVLILEDTNTHFKEFLVKLNVRPIVKKDLLKLANLMDEVETREKTLRVIFEELEREYQSDICRKCPFIQKFPDCEYRQ
ncbi:MAG: hypothetical protein N2V78_12095 [Methanophagales archaeon]|nr:hypothetical protein [Methanophagales archaeon]